jgi:hypothetical protein
VLEQHAVAVVDEAVPRGKERPDRHAAAHYSSPVRVPQQQQQELQPAMSIANIELRRPFGVAVRSRSSLVNWSNITPPLVAVCCPY